MRRFVIPVQKEELLGSARGDEYRVEELVPPRQLKAKLSECKTMLARSGHSFLHCSGGFDVCFSVLAHSAAPNEATDELKIHTLDLLMDAANDLQQHLDKIADIESAGRRELLLSLKMVLYLLCQLSEQLEASDTSRATAMKVAPKNSSKRNVASNTSLVSSWDVNQKQRLLTLLYNMLQFNLASLFEPPVVEEEVVNLIANFLFRLLESPSIALQRGKDLRTSIFQIVSLLNTRYGYTLSFTLKVVQSLQHFEHLALPLAECMELFVSDSRASNSALLEIVREICNVDCDELQRDTAATRTYAAFLTEVATRLPEVFMSSCVNLLLPHLDGDSPNLRKSILLILGEILGRVLNGEELDDEAKASRDNFLDLLEDHVHDVHGHVRATCLQIWAKLCNLQAVPLVRWTRVLHVVIGRLQDKTATVRKQAVQLLTVLLQCNPFSASLTNDENVADELDREKKKLAELESQMPSQSDGDEWNAIEGALRKLFKTRETPNEKDCEDTECDTEEDTEEETEEEEEDENLIWDGAAVEDVLTRIQELLHKHRFEEAAKLLKACEKAFPDCEMFAATSSQMNDLPRNERIVRRLLLIYQTRTEMEQHINQELESELKKQRFVVSYLSDSLAFSKELNENIGTVCMLLGSKQESDVMESINFFISAYEFGLVSALNGIRQMLGLIWSRESSVKEAVMEAYKKLYIRSETEGDSNKANAAKVVRNFMNLVTGASIAELASLEELVKMMVLSEDIDKDCFQIMWDNFANSKNEDEARAAVSLIGMVANAKPVIIKSNLELLVEKGLGSRGLKDPRLASETCKTLAKIALIKENSTPTRFECGHSLFQSLDLLIRRGFCDEKARQNMAVDHFLPMSLQATSLLYQLCEQPSRLVEKILSDLAKETNNMTRLRRLLSIGGHVALCETNHLEVAILNELKRRKAVKENLRTPKDKRRKNKRKSSNRENKENESGHVNSMGESILSATVEEGQDDLMEIVGAEADDAETEFIRSITERELLNSENVLGRFIPIVTHVCTNPNIYDSGLMTVASLALSKVMVVSSRFCENNLQLFFTLLEKSTSETIRANLVIAAGDLSVRFPNALEPWSPSIYARLRDSSTLVRSNTLTVLTHLILNDMIKVKGQISDMAVCLSDSNSKIAGLAKHFFTELARKGNALYNVMPDIVSRLSDVNEGVDEDVFRFVLAFLIALMEKDKHLESLVEKLCHRLRGSTSERQWRDFSHCLALFSHSEKTLKKLNENLSCLLDKLSNDVVHEALISIMQQGKKNAKNEVKTLIEEMEAKVAKAREKCVEDQTTNDRATQARAVGASQR